ncbi:hypothetical protein GEV33_000580 [Tenebrio molitor]|uniref:Protein Wnt n=1 Tax=Tenebrio molitor TaxID=7067 RepID=A0A8J6HUM1_TENMO|nr:hypothetical protein GEV33_000580 [Tenebrio molitor]
MDPRAICKKTKRLRGKMADICNKPALLQQIYHGVGLGQRECQYQFRYRRWNCTSSRRSIRKVLLRASSRIPDRAISKSVNIRPYVGMRLFIIQLRASSLLSRAGSEINSEQICSPFNLGKSFRGLEPRGGALTRPIVKLIASIYLLFAQEEEVTDVLL